MGTPHPGVEPLDADPARRARLRRRVATLLLCWSATLPAGEATVAVAANFRQVADALAADFERRTGHAVTVVTGSTGKLVAQVSNGAPFDVLLAADQARPARLEADGLAVAGSRFTYAVGRLVLWSRAPGRVPEDGAALLVSGAFRSIAIANPALAPYGAAAVEVLDALGVPRDGPARIVMGEDVGQAFALVATGNAELGLVALAQLADADTGSRWLVPAALHAPIRQDAVLLGRAADNAAARAFLEYLRSAVAADRIRAAGYDIPMG